MRLLALILLLLPLCAMAIENKSGVTGVVRNGKSEKQLKPPFAGAVVQVTPGPNQPGLDPKQSVKVTCNYKGEYKAHLKPGVYYLVATDPRGIPANIRLRATVVTVKANQFVKMDLLAYPLR